MNPSLLFLALVLFSVGGVATAENHLSVSELLKGGVPLALVVLGGALLYRAFERIPLAGGTAVAEEQRIVLPEYLTKEDWLVIWIGLALLLIAILSLPAMNQSVRYSIHLIDVLSISPMKSNWAQFGELLEHIRANLPLYYLQPIAYATLFAIPFRLMGIGLIPFLKSFALIYSISFVALAIGGWREAAGLSLEPSLLALFAGLVIANSTRLREEMQVGFRVESYVKLGIVLLGATFPLSIILAAGPVAIGQATVISITAVASIYFIATRYFEVDRRFAALLAVGASICGVSASLAIAAVVGATKQQLYQTITLVVTWALILVFALPFVSQALDLPAGVAGAWIGSAEVGDAVGLAAAVSYGNMVGDPDSSVQAMTLVKVVGRDLYIGVWALVWALIVNSVWQSKESGTQLGRGEIWRRFPKFTLGFFAASILSSIVVSWYSSAEYHNYLKPNLIDPLNGIRGWVFTFSFLSIGLTTRFSDLRSVSRGAVIPFSIGVLITVVLGYLFSAVIFGDYWANIGAL